jgi:DNA-binding transcriptional ArsR family regulator/uncharacterized protein YndB with AHSA1/START domain
MSAERDVWSALANPLRRSVLDQLKGGPRTTGELAAAFPELSRFAVMQHLGVLEETGLVLVRRQGRTRLNYVNPAPLEEIRQRWLNGFAASAGRAAVALKQHIEQEVERQGERHEERDQTMETATGTARAVRLESEFRVTASPARVFEALTAEQHRWYPYTYGGDRVLDIVFEKRVGGSCYEDWGDGAGHWYGVVTHYEPPTAVTIRGGLPGGTVLENNFALSARGEETVVRHTMTAFGEITDEDAKGISQHGDMSLFEPQLRAWVENGQAVR